MPSEVTLRSDATPPFIEARYHGRVTAEQLNEAATQIVAYLDCLAPLRLLADCTDLRGGHSVVDLYYTADWIARDPRLRDLREAVLMPSAGPQVHDGEFWANACGNRGINVRVFTDRAAALAWLLA